MTDVFSAINGRTSANNFAPTHVITPAQITELAQLTNQTPTSFNQQNWRLVVVSTPEAKDRLKAAAYNQLKVGDAAVTYGKNRWPQRPARADQAHARRRLH